MISAEIIEALGPDGLLVNVARGALVDEEALIAALKDGRLVGVANMVSMLRVNLQSFFAGAVPPFLAP